MRGLGIGLEGEYLVALSKREWTALQQLRAVSREAGESEHDLTAILAIVRLFLDARNVMDDLALLVDRFQAATCNLPGDDPYSKLGAPPQTPAEKEPEPVRKVPVRRRPREAGPRPTEGAGT